MKIIRNILIIGALLCVTILGVYYFAINTTKPEATDSPLVSVQEVNKAMASKENVTIVDVRTPDEYKTGHLKNSVLLTLDTIESKAAQVLPDKNQKLYVYCRTGVRSAQAVAELKQMGYTDVHSMEGGITSWQNSGYPVER